MATVLVKPLSEADGFNRRPTDSFGKLRFLYFKCVNTLGDGDAGSIVEFGWLPPGAVRILPAFARLRCTAFGASRVLKIGHRKYMTADESADVAEDDDAFSSGLDISAALASVASPMGATIKYDVYSKQAIRLFGTVTGGTYPNNAELEGYVGYLYE